MKPRKPGNIYRIWDIRMEQYLTIGYSNKTSWRRLGAVLEAAREYARYFKTPTDELVIHEFPVQQTPSAIHSIEE
jgi:hypothetical protein